MPIKRVICPERMRQIPAHFSWVDHRLVRERYIERCDACAAALYLFLVTVADAQGLSYYADTSLVHRLWMAPARLSAVPRRTFVAVLRVRCSREWEAPAAAAATPARTSGHRGPVGRSTAP